MARFANGHRSIPSVPILEDNHMTIYGSLETSDNELWCIPTGVSSGTTSESTNPAEPRLDHASIFGKSGVITGMTVIGSSPQLAGQNIDYAVIINAVDTACQLNFTEGEFVKSINGLSIPFNATDIFAMHAFNGGDSNFSTSSWAIYLTYN